MRKNRKKLSQFVGFLALRACLYTVLAILLVLLYDVIKRGGGAISWEFISQPPRRGMTEGGIFPAIVGTFIVTIVTAVLAIPLGMFAAIYLNEYARQSRLTRLIRLSIRNLSGVPSIVYGLFGVILFVNVLKFGTSILSAGLTLGLLTLPWTITASEEALKTVPNSYREGALALGATKWQAIRTNVLPYAVAGNADRDRPRAGPGRGRDGPDLVHGCRVLSPVPPQIPERPVHGPALSSLYPGHPAPRHPAGPAPGLRHGPGAYRPRPRNEHDGGRHPLSIETPTQVVKMDTPAKIETRNLNFYYGSKQALRNINLVCADRRVTAIIGPSGCGKSTFIRTLNRMNDVIPGTRVEGEILLDGIDINSPAVDVVELRKNVGMVFQKPNPFPKSIFDNIAYGLRINNGKSRTKIEEIVEKSLLEAALWEEVKDRLKENAFALSGGQQQRLCIARALAVEPKVILFDEPCSSIDPIATAKIEDLIMKLKKSYTVVIVTHNMQQAARVSDFTAFMMLGELIEFDKAEKIFTNPANKLTEDYITGRFG